MSQPYTAIGLTGTQNSPHMGAVFNGNSLLVCQTDTLARAEHIAALLNGDAERLEQAEELIGKMLPFARFPLDFFGEVHLDECRSIVAEAQKFLESNRSHV